MTTLVDTLDSISKAEDAPKKEEKPVEEKKAEDDKKDEKDETNKAILEALKGISATLSKQGEALAKALETPTDLPQSPKGTADGEDVGDKVTAPKDPYPTGDQSGIQDANGKVEDKPESDKGDLKMQEKSVTSRITSPVERPSIAQATNKSQGKADLLPYQILQKCRSVGHENISLVGKELMGLAEKYDKEGAF